MALPPEHRKPRVQTDAEKLAQIVAFATIEAIEAGHLDPFLHRLLGACKTREKVMLPRRVGGAAVCDRHQQTGVYNKKTGFFVHDSDRMNCDSTFIPNVGG